MLQRLRIGWCHSVWRTAVEPRRGERRDRVLVCVVVAGCLLCCAVASTLPRQVQTRGALGGRPPRTRRTAQCAHQEALGQEEETLAFP